jgi:hypothetical protein
MILGSEWTAYHLTPGGWVEGDKQREFAPLLSRPAPADRALSVVYKVVRDSDGAVQESQREAWREPNEVLIAELLARFGPTPQEL